MLLLLALSACDPAPVDATAELAPVAVPNSPLVEALYAGETTDAARDAGDRVRMLVWLRSLEDSVRERVCDGGLAVREARAVRDRDRMVAAEAELAALGPVYEELERALLAGPLSEDDGAAYAARLGVDRGGPGDARVVDAVYIEAVLAEAEAVSARLPAGSEGVGFLLFLLRAELGEGVRPALYEGIVGRPWEAGDFSTMARAASSEDQPQLDPAGIFTIDQGRTSRLEAVAGLRRQVLVAMALESEALGPACRALAPDLPVEP